MVLELKVPEGTEFSDLKPLLPKFIFYIISFIYVGIYWNNHHHMFQAIQKVNGSILWANLFLLFCLSLIPFTTAWMGENHFSENPVALYGLNLLLCAAGWQVIASAAIRYEGKDSKLSTAVKSQHKEWLSISLYLSGVVLSFFYPKISVFLYFVVALIWLVPDKRIEKSLE